MEGDPVSIRAVCSFACVGRYIFANFTSGRVASIGLATDPVTGAVTATDFLPETGVAAR